MVENNGKKILVIGILLIFFSSSIASGIQFGSVHTDHQMFVSEKQAANDAVKTVSITLAICQKSEMKTHTIDVSERDAARISECFKELKDSMVAAPFDEKTQQLKEELISLLVEYRLIPACISPQEYSKLLNPPWFEKLRQKNQMISHPSQEPLRMEAGSAAAIMCSLSGEGIGMLFPFVMLPRPRVITGWSTLEGVTVVGKLLTIGGFAGSGSQFGFALGFWGIGLAYATPYGTLYGFIGYSLFASVTAESLERYPPDYPPEIISVEPMDTAVDVPLSLSELKFSIEDPSGDLMKYTVTTTPDIGSGNGNLKPAGTYSIPVQGLKSLTKYTWTIQVSDDVQTIEQSFTFTTVAIAPIVSDENPVDGDRYVPETHNTLSFHLRDPQNDLMSYTVETSPSIGSSSGSGVGEGDIIVPISSLEVMTKYRWFVNVTDGENPVSEEFWFRTGPLMVFNPFAEGWTYRKMITIDHTMVTGNLQHFPVLLSITDSDLRDKAQDDGDDILFMDGVGVATRLYHEIEEFDGTTGHLVAWVNVSSLNPTIDTEFYLYYGNAGASDQQCPEKVWDSHYDAVYHMNDETTSTIGDSTQNNHDLTKFASNSPIESTDGKIGKCQSFDGSYDWMTASSWSTGSELTVSVWAKAEHNFNDDYYRIYQMEDEGSSYDYSAHGLCVSDSWQSSFNCDLSTCANQYIKYSDCVISQNQWYYLGVTRAMASRANLFLNGLKSTGAIEERSTNWAGTIDYDNMGDFKIGAYQQGSTIPYGASWWGEIDEFRLSNCVRSESWIITEYTSMMYPNSFASVGPEETGL